MPPYAAPLQNFFKNFSFPARLLKRLSGPFKKPSSARTGPATILACDFEKAKAVFVEVEKSQQKIRLTQFRKATGGGEGSGKDAELLKQCVAEGGFSGTRLRISVKGQGVIIRFIQFPQMRHDELRNAISFEVDQYIPFKAHEVVWDFCVLEENVTIASGVKGMTVLLAAAKCDDLNAHLQVFQAAGYQIDLIDIDALAAINALGFFHPESMKTVAGLLDVGIEISTLSIIQNGKPRFIRDISYGSFDILKRLKRKIGLSHEQAFEQLSRDSPAGPEALPVIQEALKELISELRVSLNYYLDQVPSAEPIKMLYVSGGVVHPSLFLENFKNETDFGFPVQALDLLSKIEVADTVDLEMLKRNQGMLPVAMGLCIRD